MKEDISSSHGNLSFVFNTMYYNIINRNVILLRHAASATLLETFLKE